MSRPVLAPLAVALSALLLAPQVLAETTSPLFVVEQQRAALVSRLAGQWSDAFAALPKERRLDHEELSSALWSLRADRLFAVSLAGDVEAVEAVLGEAKRETARPRVAAKALGDVTADLTYTPVNPCRILDTRNTAEGPLTPNVARTFDGYSINFAVQGGTASGCGIPNGVSVLALNVIAVQPTNLGFIRLWPANGVEPYASTVNYQVGITAIATGTLVPVDAANSNRFVAKSPAGVHFVADVVGYFKPPGDATSLDIKIAGQRVMRYQRNADSPNLIGGHANNSASATDRGQTVSGGGLGATNCPDPWTGNPTRDCANATSADYASVGGGLGNVASGRAATVGGGQYNTASSYIGTTVGGGESNVAAYPHATIAGGLQNMAIDEAATVGGGELNGAVWRWSTVAGGRSNWASEDYATIGGGYANRATYPGTTVAGGNTNLAEGYDATVGGGLNNSAIGDWATVPGGKGNLAGAYSVALGYRVKTQTPSAIIHSGVFAFADSNDVDFNSVGNNEFAVRATGGVRLVTAIDGTGLPTWTCGVSGGAGGSWGCTSDGNAKTDLMPLDGASVLERVAALPVYLWAAKDDPRRTPHAGPTAQDFMAAFGLGDNEKMIGFADAQGVAFAAIQGLNAKLVEKNGEIESLKAEIAELRRAVEILLTRTSPEGRIAERR